MQTGHLACERRNMGLKRTDAWGGALVLISLALGCSDDPSNPPAGRGSAACHEWQDAYCGLLAKCMAANTACDQIRGVACKSDDECPKWQVCEKCGREGECLPGCHNHKQCPEGQRCNQVQCIRCPCPGLCE